MLVEPRFEDHATRERVTSVELDHAHLHHALIRLRAGRRATELIAQLSDLRDFLVTHFATEEKADGLFEMARECAPVLAPTIALLCAQHRDLLLQLDDTLALVEPSSGDVSILTRGYIESLACSIERHEYTERSIIEALRKFA